MASHASCHQRYCVGETSAKGESGAKKGAALLEKLDELSATMDRRWTCDMGRWISKVPWARML